MTQHILELRQIGANRPWVAKITGTDPRYRFACDFRDGARDYGRSESGRSRAGRARYVLEDGLYEINAPRSWSKTDRYFAVVEDGRLRRIPVAQATALALRADQDHAGTDIAA
jgi:hypothetical protein